jgi:hypothetical protein
MNVNIEDKDSVILRQQNGVDVNRPDLGKIDDQLRESDKHLF